MPDIRAAGGDLVVVCPRLPEHSAKMQAEHQFDFSILFDEGFQLSHELKLTHEFPEDLKKVYLGFGANLPEINGYDRWILPMPARYLVDSAGLIRDSAINPDYTKRPEPSYTLEMLQMTVVS